MEKTITDIETQKNNPNRLNIYLDDVFGFGVSRFVGAWLQTGNKLSESEIEQLVTRDAREKAFQKALHYIGYHPRSEYEVRKKLIDQGFSDELTMDVVSELSEKNYINDRQFAEDWIVTRSQSKPRSQRMFTYELRKKQIEDAIIMRALEQAPLDEELALRLGKKYIRRYAHLEDAVFEKKMKGVLARKAFPFSVINKAIIQLIKMRNT